MVSNTSHTGKGKNDRLALLLQRTWLVCKWTWTAIIITIMVAFIANALSSGSTQFASSLFVNKVFPWFWPLSPSNWTVDMLLSLFILVTAVSAFYVLFQKKEDTQLVYTVLEKLANLQEHEMQVLEDLKTARKEDLLAHERNLQNMATPFGIMLNSQNKNLQHIIQHSETFVHSAEQSFQAMAKTLQDIQQRSLAVPVQQVMQELQHLSQELQTLRTQLVEERHEREKMAEAVTLLGKRLERDTDTHLAKTTIRLKDQLPPEDVFI